MCLVFAIVLPLISDATMADKPRLRVRERGLRPLRRVETGGGALDGVGGRVSPLVIAHRGASGELPENTLPAYELAVKQGSDMIEIDLHTTRDGAIVITHDENLEGLGGRGEVADATLEEIRRLDAGGGAAVPTLGEVLDAFGARIPFNLELKRSSRGEYLGMEAASVEEVARRGLLGQTLFSRFFYPFEAISLLLVVAMIGAVLLAKRRL